MRVHISQFFKVSLWLLLVICVSVICVSFANKNVKAKTLEVNTFISQRDQANKTKKIDFVIRVQNNQTFSTLMQQAEVQATVLIRQTFTENARILEVTINALGERDGQQAPLLSSKVLRSDWQRQPEIQQWTKYFGSSAVLLGFSKPEVQQSTSQRSVVTSTQRSTSTPTMSTSKQQSISPLSAGIYTPSGERIEADDPGYR